MKARPDFTEDFHTAITEWRTRHALREDDAILLCLELFHIHQRHWDELRHQDLPSFSEFRETVRNLKTTAGTLQKDSSALIDELRQRRTRRTPAATSLILIALLAIVTGILIGKFLL